MNSLDNQNVGLDFGQYFAQLLPYAYNIIGDSMAAEDVVQEILNNHYVSPQQHIHNLKSYLIRSVINRSINEKKKIRVRDNYNGEWLPAPINTEEIIYENVDRNHILQYSLLVLLEKLNPKERAVFILKETFDFTHDEISDLLEVTAENSRQLFRRAKQKLEPDFNTSFEKPEFHDEILNGLANAILNADIEGLKTLLADDVRSLSDGGYKAKAAQKIILGKENVGKFLQAMYGKYLLPGTTVSFTQLNHRPSILFRLEGLVYRCIILEFHHQQIASVYIIVNPDKLHAIQ